MTRAFLGGSFDPVHSGHVAMAEHVLGKGLASMVHVVPAWQSPFKGRAVVTAADRLAMVRLAFAGLGRVTVEEDEILAERACYTVATLDALQSRLSADRWLLMIGADNLAGLVSWHDAGRLQQLATVVVMGREGCDLSDRAIRTVGLDPERVLPLPDFCENVSSTAVRDSLAAGPRSLAALVTGGLPESVARYILQRGLYLPRTDGESLVPDSD